MVVGSTLLSFLFAAPLAAQAVGTWKLASQPDLPALISQATAAMNPADRETARDRIRKTNTIHPLITITRAAGSVTIKYGDGRPQHMPDSALAVAWTREDGEKVLISARSEGGNLIQTVMGEDGMRENVFHVERGVLTLRVTIKAMMLPKPITYTLTYHP